MRRLRWAGMLGLTLSLGIVAWVLAYWFWHWAAPRPTAMAIALPDNAVLADAALFGFAATTSGEAAPAAVAATSGDWRLVGVLAQVGGGGWALLRRGDGSVKLLREGAELAGELRLERVFPTAIEISKNGVRRSLNLPALAHASTTSGGGGKCPLSAEERRRAYFVRPELLPGLAQSLEAARKLFRQDGQGWIVTASDPTLSALGFAAGDRVEKGNGVPLLTEDLLRTAIVEPLLQNRVLRLSGARATKPREWIFVNAALCGP